MTLATTTPAGKPSARMVLLKGADHRGFTFFTNYLSRKAGELLGNPRAALVFYWPELDRQVRVTGRVSMVSAAESDAYFATRHPESRFSATASPQSRVIPSREALELEVARIKSRYPDSPPPRPKHWGGFRVRPEEIEFWQSGEHRLHDRIRFRKARAGAWIRERLAP